jgi:hypothetical protein
MLTMGAKTILYLCDDQQPSLLFWNDRSELSAHSRDAQSRHTTAIKIAQVRLCEESKMACDFRGMQIALQMGHWSCAATRPTSANREKTGKVTV